MDWLRRNWPDLAIGVALVGVIAGIVATLVTGGSFFPVGPTAEPPAAQPPAAVGPATPGSAAEPAAPADDPVAPAVGDPTPFGAVSVLTPDGAEPADAPSEGASPASGSLVAPAASTPAAQPDAATTPAGPEQPVAEPAAEPAAPAATPTPTPAPAATTPAPAPAASGPLPGASSDADAPYRVSVGAFGNADNAERLAASFREAGYPVFTGEQGSLTIVLVGPYAAESEAQQVAARISAGGFGIDPVVYRFRPDAPTPGASTPAPGAVTPVPEPAAAPTPAAAPAAAPTPAPAAAPAAAPAPIATSSSGRSLQVGAFADAGSARPLQERLATVGLRAFEVREDGLTKLLVGPFDVDGLAAARERLAELGIESFPR